MAELVHVHNCMNMNRRALAWPRPSHNLTFVPRRPQHRLSSKAGYKSWRHPLAPKLPNSRYHIPAPNPSDCGATLMTPRWPSRPQRGPEHPQPNQTDHLDQDLDVHQNFVPDYSEGPVAGHAQCWLTDDTFQQAGAGDISSVSAAVPFPIVGLVLTFLRE